MTLTVNELVFGFLRTKRAYRLDANTVKQWKSDLRRMTKIYKSLPFPEAFSKDPAIDAKWVEAERLFKTFLENLQGILWQGNLLRDKGWIEKEIQDAGSDAIYSIRDHFLFPKYREGGFEYAKIRNERDTNIRRYQKSFNRLFKALDKMVEVQGEREVLDPYEKTRVGPANVVIHNKGRKTGNPDHDETMEWFIKSSIVMLDRTFKMVQRRGFGKALPGLTIHIKLDRRSDAAMTYDHDGDDVTIYQGGLGNVDELVHEIGHRHWYRVLGSNARRYWSDMWKEHKLPTTSYGDTKDLEAYAEAFKLYVFKGPNALKPMTRQVFENTVSGGRKLADLAPPLGYPGGTCQVVERIEDNVHNPRLQDSLQTKVERGKSLSNPEAAKVYNVEIERGPWKFKRLRLSIHAQYRMDLRGVTVPEVRMSLGNFFRHYNTLKSRGDAEAQKMELAMMRREKVTWTDPKLQNMTIVFAADIQRGEIDVISLWWQGQPDPAPSGSCNVPPWSSR